MTTAVERLAAFAQEEGYTKTRGAPVTIGCRSIRRQAGAVRAVMSGDEVAEEGAWVRKNGAALKVALVVFITATTASAARDVISPGEAWEQPSRSIGAPLTGYWGARPFKACYDYVPIKQFNSDRLTLFKRSGTTSYPETRISILRDNRIRIDYPDDPETEALRTAAIFRDYGDRIEWEKVIVDSKETLFNKKTRPPGYFNCGIHTPLQRLSLLLKRPFHREDYSST